MLETGIFRNSTENTAIQIQSTKNKHFYYIFLAPFDLFTSKSITAKSNHAGNFIRKLHKKKPLSKLAASQQGVRFHLHKFDCNQVQIENHN